MASLFFRMRSGRSRRGCYRENAPERRAAWFLGKEASMSTTTVNVRYMVADVGEAVAWYTTHLGFTLVWSAAPAFAEVERGPLHLLLSGRTSSAGRAMPDGRQPEPGGWNRILD